MKSMVKHSALVALLSLFSVHSFGQCISTFPYFEDFENATVLQEISSCDAWIKGDTSGGWQQPFNDAGEWRVDTAGTPTIGTGPGSTRNTSGEGIGTDYSPGTTSGKYFYVESTTDTLDGCFLQDFNLLSPCFDLSGTAYYRLKFAYHMFGSEMGALHIDILDGVDWVNDYHVIKGEQGENWDSATVELTGFNNANTRIRFRFTAGWSIRSDCAIDAVKIEKFTPVTYDGQIVHMDFVSNEYMSVPPQHAKDISVRVNLRNNGKSTVTGTKVSAIKNWNGSSTFDSIVPGKNMRDTFSARIDHNDLGGRDVDFQLAINEQDSVTANNNYTLRTNLSDTVYARDDSSFSGSLAYTTGSGKLGSMYELLEDDTLTSVSFFLNNPDADSTRMYLYTYTTAPDQLIATSDFIPCSNNVRWYTAKFNCSQVLKKGKYFIALEQVDVGVRVELGYIWGLNYVPNTQYYDGGGGWTEIMGSNFPGTFLVRVNLGESGPKLSIAGLKDTICQGEILQLEAKGGVKYKWSPAALFGSPTSKYTTFRGDTTVTIRLDGQEPCGIPGFIEKTIVIKKQPSAVTSPDTTVCLGDSVHLRASTSNPYTWKNGPSNSDFKTLPLGDRSYDVRIDSTNGCSKTYQVNVNTSTPDLKVTPDTGSCEGDEIVLYATGGLTYEWDNGVKSDKNPVTPSVDDWYYVTAANALGCERTDSVFVKVDSAPATKVSNDTAVCFGQRLTLRVSGGVSHQWKGGPSSGEWNILPLTTKEYTVSTFGANSCVKRDTIHVAVASIPSVKLHSDTTICEGESLELEAITTDDVVFLWNTGDTSRKITVSPMADKKYKVDVSNSTNCAASDSMMISVDPLPLAGLELTQDGANVTLINTSSDAGSYTWHFGDGDSSTSTSVVHKYRENGEFTIKLTARNNCGSDDTTVTVVVDVYSVNDLENALGVKVRPNPSGEGSFTVSFDGNQYGKVSLILMDPSGRHLQTTIGNKSSRSYETTVDVSSLSAGVYLLQVKAGEGRSTVRVAVY